MHLELDYAPPLPRYRRFGFVALVTLPILIASYTLAVPKLRTFRDHEARRADVRRQFEAELANANTAMGGGDLNGAALALFNAEFPTRVERHLFTSFTAARFDRQLAVTRTRFDQALAVKLRAEADAARLQAEAWRREQEEAKRRPPHEDERYRICCEEPMNRRQTVNALHERAITQLKNGKTAQASRICQQIVMLDPAHDFDAGFWSNVQPKP